jgi:hypothetical protein
MKVENIKIEKVLITLTLEQAAWLKRQVQPGTARDEEGPIMYDWRVTLYKELKKATGDFVCQMDK